MGGLIIDRVGRIPAAGEDVTLEYGGLEFTVLEVEDRRVGKDVYKRQEMGLQIFFSRAHPQNIGDVFAALCRRIFIPVSYTHLDVYKRQLEDAPLPSPLSEAQRVFCFGLSVLCEYEQRDEIFRYLL